ncbi:YihY/virulence factor BrkB family protein [Microbacterium sp. 22242]|uniref:YihY/virulence factor BrkB family protein n=1 Tax=Microbacterium sp. 22242 TaxID=3453896 RepID=UPI003F86104F
MAPQETTTKPWAARTMDAAVARALRLRLTRAWLLYSEKHGPALADGITYRALFSVFAAVLLGFSAAGLWLTGDPPALASVTAAVDRVIPGLVGHGGVIDLESIKIPATLSITGVVSLFGLVGAALGAIGSLRIALRTLADKIADDVLWYWVLLRNLGLAAGIAVAFALTSAITVLSGLGVTRIAGLLGAAHSVAAIWLERIIAILILYVLDAAVIVGLFVVLSGVRAPAKRLWQGATMGAVGLVVLQQLSSLFLGGAKSNPLLATFSALIALLLWLNLSAQVMLLASAWIIVAVEDAEDPPLAGARSLAERRLDRAELLLQAARDEREAARAQLGREHPDELAERDAARAREEAAARAAEERARPRRRRPWYRRLLPFSRRR